MKSLLIALAAIIFSITSSAAQAQKKPSLFIGIEDLSEYAQKCGITKESLRAPAVLILRQNRIDVANEYTQPYLYIKLNIGISGASCVYNLIVSINTSQYAEDRNGFKANDRESVKLCSFDGFGITSVNRTPTVVTEQIEQLLKGCLAAVTY
jgi:hypothetical protein